MRATDYASGVQTCGVRPRVQPRSSRSAITLPTHYAMPGAEPACGAASGSRTISARSRVLSAFAHVRGAEKGRGEAG
eukprot:2967732-Rhodomonas_salina.1